MSIPHELRTIIDEDLSRIRAELARLAPSARIVLAGSLAFDEPWAWRDPGGRWVIESDYDLYLVLPGLAESLAIAKDSGLRDLGARLGTRATVDPYVIWQPLLDRGLVGMVGRWVDDDSFVDCQIDPWDLRVNQARKALIRQRLLAPREEPERARYQLVKAAIEALRSMLIGQHPQLSTRALFSLAANLRWLRSVPQGLAPEDRSLLQALLEQRLDPTRPAPGPESLERVRSWLDRWAQDHRPTGGSSSRRRPSSATLRAWMSWLGHGLIPDPRLDYDTALVELLADPSCARLAGDLEAQRAFEGRWRNLGLAPWLPRRPGALIRAVDGALGNPLSTRGERYLDPEVKG